MGYNEDIDPSPPQDISNVFAAADLLSKSTISLLDSGLFDRKRYDRNIQQQKPHRK